MTELTERRFTPGRVEVRANAEKRTIGGYAAVFNSPSQNLGGFRERLAPGVFNRSASRGWPGNGTGRARPVQPRRQLPPRQLGVWDAAAAARRGGFAVRGRRPRARDEDVYELIVHAGTCGRRRSRSTRSRTSGRRTTPGSRCAPSCRLGVTDVAPVNTPAYLDTSAGPALPRARSSTLRYKEIEQMAKANELVRLFKRTAEPEPIRTMSSVEAMAKVINL
jgi:hypothetical protein